MQICAGMMAALLHQTDKHRSCRWARHSAGRCFAGFMEKWSLNSFMMLFALVGTHSCAGPSGQAWKGRGYRA